eukprot:SAG31_NODE_144_length_22617_cov_21.520117_5_plen_223_part_00
MALLVTLPQRFPWPPKRVLLPPVVFLAQVLLVQIWHGKPCKCGGHRKPQLLQHQARLSLRPVSILALLKQTLKNLRCGQRLCHLPLGRSPSGMRQFLRRTFRWRRQIQLRKPVAWDRLQFRHLLLKAMDCHLLHCSRRKAATLHSGRLRFQVREFVSLRSFVASIASRSENEGLHFTFAQGWKHALGMKYTAKTTFGREKPISKCMAQVLHTSCRCIRPSVY